MIVKIDFHGDILEAIKRDGQAWASLRVMCRALGLDYSGQLQKLKGKPWAGMEKFSTPDARGRPQERVASSTSTRFQCGSQPSTAGGSRRRCAWALLRVMCRALKLDYSGQLQKLKGKPWATMEKFSIVDPSGATRETCFLNIDAVPMWLAGIETSCTDHLCSWSRRPVRTLVIRSIGRYRRCTTRS